MNHNDANEDRYHVAASSSLTASGARVLKSDDTFALVNRFGDIHPLGEGEQGLYHRGTRHVSKLELRLAGRRPLLLSSSMLHDNVVLAVDLSNPDLHADVDRQSAQLAVPHGTLHIARRLIVRDGLCVQQLVLSNHGADTVEAPLEVAFDADFVDIFEVRGTERARHGSREATSVASNSAVLAYRGLDGRLRCTRLVFQPTPSRMTAETAEFRVRLAAKESFSICAVVACELDTEVVKLRDFSTALAEASALSRGRLERECSLHTSNDGFNAWLDRSRFDLHMLLTQTTHGPYPYAGVPWFSTPFGRDGIWTALQLLWLAPEYAAGVLRFLSATQSQHADDSNDAEPGKIVHEIRDGEMASLREVPFGKYYGSVDSTPLYLMLAWSYYQATADRALIREIWPNLLKAAEWLEKYGDLDGDGFIEYGRRSRDGLTQQGWKDSGDSVFHADGSLAEGPIALCEVQGYAYAARIGLAGLAEAMGQPELSSRFARDAAQLRERFDSAFWCEELSSYALALDGKKRPCRVRASNAAHCLFSGIAVPDRAAALSRQLLSDEMFSGWGVRTLATSEVRYNPMSYHNGSIWPHDNAIAAEGIARYGFRHEALRILSGMFGAACSVELNRLPELFCGFSRKPGQGPTLYPVACSPQAWSAGAVFLLLKAVLGLEVDALARRITLRSPSLPDFLNELWLTNLRVGGGSVDLRLQRYPGDVGITVLRKQGDVQIATLK